MKRLQRFLDSLLRTCFCAIWIISGLLFVFNAACGLAETDPTIATGLMIRAGWFGGIMLLGIIAHVYLIDDHIKKCPPKDDGSYPNWDL